MAKLQMEASDDAARENKKQKNLQACNRKPMPRALLEVCDGASVHRTDVLTDPPRSRPEFRLDFAKRFLQGLVKGVVATKFACECTCLVVNVHSRSGTFTIVCTPRITSRGQNMAAIGEIPTTLILAAHRPFKSACLRQKRSFPFPGGL